MEQLKETVSFAPGAPATNPSLTPAGDDPFRPVFPLTAEELDVPVPFLRELALKTLSLEPDSSTSTIAQRMGLGRVLTESLLTHLTRDRMIEVKGVMPGSHNHRYAMLERGWAEVLRLLETNNYIGVAPVALQSYTDRLNKQVRSRPAASHADLDAAMSHLVLSDGAKQMLGLVVSSGRSLFLSGPSGNGKTAVSRALVNAIPGHLWIPHAIVIDGQVIRLYDNHIHQAVKMEDNADYDRRWIKIKPPLVVVGGELTLESMELQSSPVQRYYEAPFQMKSNGGVLLVDDLGRQRCSPEALLNRWIVPLENKIDFLSLNTGKKIEVPFEQILIFSTNLSVSDLADEAFLRRMGYRMAVMAPAPDTYERIFREYAKKRGLTVDDKVLPHLEQRYGKEHKEPKSCEPRDLIDRAIEVCKYNREQPRLTTDIIDIAWNGYFGAVAVG